MSEEVKIKISQPMFEVEELEVFDNNIPSIVEEYSKLMLKEKDQILTQRIIIKQEKEIERLEQQLQQKENIIKELEKVLDRNIELNYYKNNVRQYNKTLTEGAIMYRDYIKEKLQELKGDSSNDSKRDV